MLGDTMKLRTRDIAACANISPYVVREYIDAGLLGPMYRSENNYRWIDPRAVPQACVWRTLQEEGLAMEQLREFGCARTPEKALEMLRNHDERLKREVSELRKRQDMLRSYAALIREGKSVRPGEVVLRIRPARPVHCAPLGPAGGGTDTYKSLRECIARLPNGGCPLGYAYSDIHSLLERPDAPAQLVSFDPKGAAVRPAGAYLVAAVACDSEQEGGLARRMLAYAAQNDLELRGPAWSVYLHDAVSAAGPEQYLLQISVMATHIVAGT